jgi:CBS domain-containing protein/gamma-glutamyl:cysteine ligase YbdK (ATP-grasp superfamily)
MGQHSVLEGQDDARTLEFQQALLTDLNVFEQLWDTGALEDSVGRVGAEQEFFLVDQACNPAPVGPEVLAKINDPRVTTELGRFNLEANLSPRTFSGRCLREMEHEVNEVLDLARHAAASYGCDVLLAGILPTARQRDLTLDNLTPKPRYFELDRNVRRLRGENYHLLIRGLDELQITHDNIMLEASCTSFQVHFQVSASNFARVYNVAQLVAAPVLAAATNSPVFLAHRLWHETRIAVFQHSVDERSGSQVARNHPTRVGFGERWVERSAIEIFREDITRFPVIMTVGVKENAREQLKQGKPPELAALRLHNSTVWRWNRVCYGVLDGQPHLRIEIRSLPSGPTVLDEVANAAFQFGLLVAVDQQYGPVEKRFRFEDAKYNFLAAARHGLGSQLTWLDGQRHPASALILKELLPLARAGLKDACIDPEDIERYLGTVEERVRRDQTGSQWVFRALTSLDCEGTQEAQHRCLTEAMLANQKTGRPVHTWSLPGGDAMTRVGQLVQDIMSTDLVTVQPNSTVQLVANIMDWRHICHVLVEDEDGRFCGLISHRDLLHVLAKCGSDQGSLARPIREIMNPDPVVTAPATQLGNAIQTMLDARTDALAVVSGDRLVGIVTTQDVLTLLGKMLTADQNDRPKEKIDDPAGSTSEAA